MHKRRSIYVNDEPTFFGIFLHLGASRTSQALYRYTFPSFEALRMEILARYIPTRAVQAGHDLDCNDCRHVKGRVLQYVWN